MSNNKKDDQKIAKAFAKGFEAAVSVTDLSGKVQDAIALQQSLQTQIEQPLRYENQKPGNMTQEELQTKKGEGIQGQIETAGDIHDKQKKKNIEENKTNDKQDKSKAISRDEPEKKAKQMKENGNSITKDEPEKKMNQMKDNGKSITKDEPEKKVSQMKDNGKSIAENKSAATNNETQGKGNGNSKVKEFKENGESITKSHSSGNSGGGGGGNNGGNNSSNNNKSQNKPRYNGPSY